ncbi:unnamed protein product [Cunninghamella blakesleeana]
MDPSHNHSAHESHIISQQVFGSSKKLQFIGISPMDSLLSAIDQQTQQTKPSTHQTMSIESLLDSNGDTSNKHKRHYNSIVEDNINVKSVKRKYNNNTKLNTPTPPPTTLSQQQQLNDNNNNNNHSQSLPHLTSQMTTITCYHAAVAQKSYGSEKRFLCPPPIVQVQSPNSNISSSCRLTMAVVSENGDKPLEQHATLDDNHCTFKYLHVTGTAKAKQFSLRVNITSTSDSLLPPTENNDHDLETISSSSSPLYATFLSHPISIISKPSKKTSKARNVSTCVLANQPVSLFNRINSQTVRTKYMTSDNKKLCAKNSSWSPFEIIVLHQPTQYQTSQRPQSSSSTASTASNNNSNNSNSNVQPLIYGSEIILKDTKTNICSQPVIIRKVDKGRIVPGAYGPVSQMQKIALQLSRPPPTSPTSLLYLSAISASETNDTGVVPAHSPHASILDFAPSRIVPDGLESYEKVEDYLCWTIVGISTFEYSFYDNQAQPLSSTPSSSSLPSINNNSNNNIKSTSSSLTSSPSLKFSPSPSLSSSITTSSSNLCSLTSSPISSPSLNLLQHHQHFQSNSLHHSYTKSASASSLDSTNNNTRCITPFPIITSIHYKALTHSLDIIGQHLMQAVPSPKLLQLWLGSHHEPLKITLQPQPPQPHQTHILVDLPSTQDLIIANHDRLKSSSNTNNGRRTLELPLYFVREDGVVYHSGKALICEMLINTDAGRWSIVDVRQ